MGSGADEAGAHGKASELGGEVGIPGVGGAGVDAVAAGVSVRGDGGPVALRAGRYDGDGLGASDVSWSVSNEEIYAKLEQMHQLMLLHFGIIEKKENAIMTAMTDLQAKVAAEDTVIASAITLLQGLSAALAAAGTDPTALAALNADITTQTTNLAAAVLANTPTPTTSAPPVSPTVAVQQARAAS